MVAELSLASGSVSLAATVAVLLNWPVDCGTTTMLATAELPLARLPKLQITVAVPLHVPCVGVAGPKVTPAGRVSVTVTLVAGDGPLLVTEILYVRLATTIAGLGEAVLVKERLALVGPATISDTDTAC